MSIGPESYLIKDEKLTREARTKLIGLGLIVQSAHVRVDGSKRTAMVRVHSYGFLTDEQRSYLIQMNIGATKENIPGISRVPAGV